MNFEESVNIPFRPVLFQYSKYTYFRGWCGAGAAGAVFRDTDNFITCRSRGQSLIRWSSTVDAASAEFYGRP